MGVAQIKRTVIVTTQFEALHSWPGCNLPVVGFLASPHRHIFKVRAEVRVTHNDRAVEFFCLKSDVDGAVAAMMERYVVTGLLPYLPMSCEMMAEFIFDNLLYDVSAVEVWEDGENGARYEVTNKEDEVK